MTRNNWRGFLFFFALVTVLTWLRYDYHTLMNDHFVLDLKGIHQADPSTFQGDWFVEEVPQPHWINDSLVRLAEEWRMLNVFKFVYWLGAIAFYALALSMMNAPVLAAAASLLVALGPTSPLGSATAILGWALPHSMGGALLILGFMALLTKRRAGLFFCALMTPLAHAQQGFHLAILMIAACVFAWRERKDFQLLVVGTGALGLSIYIAKAGGVAGLGEAYSRVCESYASFHCFSSLWPAHWFLPAPFLLSGIYFWSARRWNKEGEAGVARAVAFIAVMYTLSLALEYLRIAPFDGWTRQLNTYRWITLLMFVACWGWLEEFFVKKQTVALALAGIPVFFWLFAYTSSGSSLEGIWLKVVWATVALLLIAGAFWMRRAFTLAALTLLAGATFNGSFNFLQRSYLETLGEYFQRVIPPGETIIADPNEVWLRRVSKRATIADFKAIPYNNPHFAHWEERIRDLNGFEQWNYWQLQRVAEKYDARYVLVAAGDVKINELDRYAEKIVHLPGFERVLYKLNFQMKD